MGPGGLLPAGGKDVGFGGEGGDAGACSQAGLRGHGVEKVVELRGFEPLA